MKRLLSLAFTVLFLSIASFAQTSPCPTITVSGPSGIVPPEEPMIFTASVSGIETKDLKYQWTVSGGEIQNGQGTLILTVKVPDRMIGQTTAVTIEVLGLSKDCHFNTASASAEPICGLPPETRKIDEYSTSPLYIRKERLENITAELGNDPIAIAYIVETFKRGTPPTTMQGKIGKTFDYLRLAQGVEIKRLNFFVSFGNENYTRLFITPAGADAPQSDGKIVIRGSDFKKDLAKAFPKNKKN